MNWLKYAEAPLTEWSPEYRFMLALAKLLGQEGVSREKAMAIVNAEPIKTVSDVEAITTKLWRLALEHGIPEEYLYKKLPDSKIR